MKPKMIYAPWSEGTSEELAKAAAKLMKDRWKKNKKLEKKEENEA